MSDAAVINELGALRQGNARLKALVTELLDKIEAEIDAQHVSAYEYVIDLCGFREIAREARAALKQEKGQ